MKQLDKDLNPVESSNVSQDTVRLIEQLEEWFQMRRDALEQYKGTKSFVIGDQTVTDERFIQGLKVGLHVALETFGKTLPISVAEDDEE
ncbi:hypothetical protein [Shewanella sp. T24-MNA-CIBAN-0130]|uniref:hypothetical protein n=1 Tax=Shewanella sp. T24-MNA-CIBAN-0130 TaxID=3140470 RepID=UPI00332490B8